MRVEFDYSDGVWAVMPLVGAEADEAWIDEQVAIAREHYPHRAREAKERALAALEQRREGIATSLYFRPPLLPATGVLHLSGGDVVIADEEFVVGDWIPAEASESVPPTVMEFETEHSPHGIRVAYLAGELRSDGADLGGLTYGLRFDNGVCAVFSELADRESTALLQIAADPVVSSIRLVP